MHGTTRAVSAMGPAARKGDLAPCPSRHGSLQFGRRPSDKDSRLAARGDQPAMECEPLRERDRVELPERVLRALRVGDIQPVVGDDQAPGEAQLGLA